MTYEYFLKFVREFLTSEVFKFSRTTGLKIMSLNFLRPILKFLLENVMLEAANARSSLKMQKYSKAAPAFKKFPLKIFAS
jgi:hypothetical protein